jgi:hypothetical protein
MVVVASREPGTPAFCWAATEAAAAALALAATPTPNWRRVTPLRAMTDLPGLKKSCEGAYFEQAYAGIRSTPNV